MAEGKWTTGQVIVIVVVVLLLSGIMLPLLWYLLNWAIRILFLVVAVMALLWLLKVLVGKKG